MATNPIPAIPSSGVTEAESARAREEWWDFVFSLKGSAKEMFAEVGGSEAWIRFLRDEEVEETID